MSNKQPDPDEVAIRALDAEWGKAARAKDIDRVVNLYTRDGAVLWPDHQIGIGHATIRALWKEIFEAPNFWLDFRPERVDIASGRDMATDVGAVHFAPDAKPNDPNSVGKYLVVWKRENGTWKVFYDCFNMNGSK